MSPLSGNQTLAGPGFLPDLADRRSPPDLRLPLMTLESDDLEQDNQVFGGT